MDKTVRLLNHALRPALLVGTLVAVSLMASGPLAAASKTKTTTAPTVAPSFAPAASGTIASIFGQDLEVQGTSGQTTVDLTAKTAITATVPLALRDVTVGTCISATGTKGAGGKVDATVVTITAAVKGSCLERGGFGAGGGAGFRGGSGGGSPRTTGTVPARSTTANVAGAFGKVTKVSGSTITVEGISFAGFGGRPPSGTSKSKPTTPKASPQTVVVSSKTRYSKTEKVTAGALKVGECATAFGSTNDIGVVNATRLTVTQPVDGSCTTGFGFRGGSGGADVSPDGGAAGAAS
jgi:hypothetical protein